MNKRVLAWLTGAVVLAPGLVLAEGPRVYGKINLSLEQERFNDEAIPANDTDTWKLDNNASRLGVKGDFGLDVADLEAFYKAEFEIHPDDGEETSNNGVEQVLDQRNIYGGVRGAFGSVQAGYFDSPLKSAQMDVDQFSDLDADIKNILAGENRYANQIMYRSPTLAKMLTLNLSAIQNEGQDDLDGDGEVETDIGDSVSASLVMEHEGFYGALAMDRDSTDGLEVDSETGSIDITRVTAGFNGEQFEVGALYQIAADNAEGSDAEDSSWVVSGAWKLDRYKFKVQGGRTEGDVSGDELSLAAIGLDYKLNKQSKVFSYYAASRLDADAPGSDTDMSTFGLGVQHKF
jgi:predicted porin